LRIDGSGELRRVLQTRNIKYDYWNETHASPSPDGSQIIWSSNWGTPAVRSRITSHACRGLTRRWWKINASVTEGDSRRVCHAQRPIGF